MPLNTDPHLPAHGQITLDDWLPGVQASARAAFQHSLELNPTVSAQRALRYVQALDNEDQLTCDAIIQEAQEWEKRKWRMSEEDQLALIRAEGLDGQIKPDENYDEEILTDVIVSRREANARKIVQSKDGWQNFLPNLGAGLFGGMLDPVNVAAAAVPIIPAGAVGGALRSAAGPIQRAMIYAKVGAANGAIGTAALEPLIYTGQKLYQSDYDCAMSLQNIALGALMASGFHSLFGSAGDALRDKRGLSRWWERLEPTEASERARQRLFEDTAKAYRDAGTSLSEKQIRIASEHASDVFDGWARETAYHADVPVEQLYREFQVDIRSGEIARRKLPGWDKEEYYRLMEEQGNNFRHPQSVVDEAFDAWVSRTLLDPDNTMSAKELRRTFRFNPLTEEIERADGQRFKPTDRRWKALEEVEGETLYATKRSQFETLDEFLADLSGRPVKNEEKYYFHFNDRRIERPDDPGKSYRVRLSEDAVRHIEKDHPGYKSWAEIPDVLQNGSRQLVGYDRSLMSQIFAYVVDEGEKKSVVLAYPGKRGGHGDYQNIVTAFKSKAEAVDDYIAKYVAKPKRAARVSGAGGSPAAKGSANRIQSIYTERLGGTEESLSSPAPAVNKTPDGGTLHQRDVYGEVQGAIRFNAANTEASIRVMRAADVSTGPHEMVHAVRRFTETLAVRSHASHEMRLRYEKQCEFVGARPGEKWTRAQEEKFADAYLKFLWDGSAPSAHLAQSFEDMNAEMRKIYCEVQWRGLEVSPQLARMFERINRVPLSEDLERADGQRFKPTDRRWKALEEVEVETMLVSAMRWL